MRLEELAILSERPIAFHPCLARIGGGVAEGVFLSQLLYWTGKGRNSDGWIYKTLQEWRDETVLSRREIYKARDAWKRLGVLSEKREGLPCRVYYHVNLRRLGELLREYAANRDDAAFDDDDSESGVHDVDTESLQDVPQSLYETGRTVGTTCANPHINTETTTETTTEITTERGNSIANAIEAASAATPPRTKTKRSDPRTSHPAIQAARQATGRYPPKELYDQVISTLGDKPDQQRLDRCRRSWLARGYNPNAWTWLLEWYPQGIPRNGHRVAQSQDPPPAPQPAVKTPRREIPWYSTLTGEYFDGKTIHKVGPDFDWSKFAKEPAKT